MCGIVARAGSSTLLADLLAGLAQLEYRGYDSAGIALSGRDRAVSIVKESGRLRRLVARLPEDHDSGAAVGIGHTRWATHGEPTADNAHPHQDCTGRLAVVHNGIVENVEELRQRLTFEGHQLRTPVDTEVIAHLVEEALAETGDLPLAVAAATRRMSGSWALAVLQEGSDVVVLARNRSPLLVASSPSGGHAAASDATALPDRRGRVWSLDDGHIVELTATGLSWRDGDGAPVSAPKPLPAVVIPRQAVLGDNPDHTVAEIGEQAGVVGRILDRDLDRIVDGRLADDLGLPAFQRVKFLACGSSRYASEVLAGVVRAVGGIPAEVEIASEPRQLTEPGTLLVALSQSGETADVLQSVEHRTAPLLALTNTSYSSLARMADSVYALDAGPEVGVAATKTFTAQVVGGTALLLSALSRFGHASQRDVADQAGLLAGVDARLAATDAACRDRVGVVAERMTGASGVLFLSRGAGIPYAGEGALKLAELTYLWSLALPAGELKHGPIALIADGTPTVVVSAEPAIKLETGIAEVRARGADVISIGGRAGLLPVVAPRVEPAWGPLESVVALQHLARAVALALGNDVDRPRNLAKSVTVV